jgi:flagellar hook protein FlgE
MNNALLAGVSGLSAHQTMLDVAGNNLSNVNTTAFKSSRVTFSELLNQTMKQASQPTETTGGTNPLQIGSGVQVASVDRDMSQGSLLNTGRPLDMAIEGSGYFVLNDGQRDVYTRVGAFSVDSEYYLVDPGTGARVQRIGSEGVDEGFQDASSNDIRIPYDVALPAKATATVNYTGNLSANENDPTTHLLTSVTQYTAAGAVASKDTTFDQLDQGGSTLVAGDQIVISGTRRDGTTVAPVAFDLFTGGGAPKELEDLLAAIDAEFTGSSASINNGEIRLRDDTSGYSRAELNLEMSAGSAGSLTLPNSFKILTAGGQTVKNTNVEIYDSQGIAHVLSAAFVRTDIENQWDMVLTSITGEVQLHDRRIQGISFLADGSFGGIEAVEDPDNPGNFITDNAQFDMEFANDPGNIRPVAMDMGTVGGFDGLSQFGGASTVAPSGQDGYASGWLSSMSVTREGVLMGVFTNGIRRDIAAMKIATFQNPAGLEGFGNNYFNISANSGNPVATRALSGGAGAIQGGSLEKSNVEVAAEFVNMIQAQNGFQANARTITVANEMLRELTSLIR